MIQLFVITLAANLAAITVAQVAYGAYRRYLQRRARASASGAFERIMKSILEDDEKGPPNLRCDCMDCVTRRASARASAQPGAN